MTLIQVTAIIGAAASLLCTLVVGALTFFIKKTLTDLTAADKANADSIAKVEDSISKTADKLIELTNAADKANADKIAKVEDKLNDLKADLPLLYVTREDYIRIMNRVEEKLDRLLYGNGNSSGKEKEA